MCRVRLESLEPFAAITPESRAGLEEAVIYPQIQVQPTRLWIREEEAKDINTINQSLFLKLRDLTIFFFFPFFPQYMQTAKRGQQGPGRRSMRLSPFDTGLISKCFMKGHTAGLEASWNLVCIKSFSRLKKFRNSSSWEDEVYLHDARQMSA